MQTPQQRLDRIEEAMKLPPAETDHLYFPAGMTKEEKVESMMLMLHKASDHEPPVNLEALRARALELVESGEYDAPEDAGEGVNE